MSKTTPVRIINDEIPANFSSGSLLQLLQNIDRLKPQLLPLSNHHAKKCDAHTKECYASLLAAVIMADGTVTDSEARLFYLLLGSLGLEKMPAVFFENAHALNQKSLGDFFRAMKEADIEKVFILDALLLSRIDGPITESAAIILGEIAEILAIDVDELQVLAALACHILGIKNSTPIPFHWNQDFFSIWHQFLYRKITMQDLLKGIDESTGIPNFDSEATAALTATIIDEKTGSQWMRCCVGQEWNGETCTGKANELNAEEAWRSPNQVNRLNYAGFNDWRVPEIDELLSLRMLDAKESFKINHEAFPNHPGPLWSSTGKDSYNTHYLYSDDTSYDDNYKRKFVRLVRTPQ